jgi:hypothetical protein
LKNEIVKKKILKVKIDKKSTKNLKEKRKKTGRTQACLA